MQRLRSLYRENYDYLENLAILGAIGLLKFIILSAIIALLSLLTYIYIRYLYIPTALEVPVYFNFNLEQPIAKINLLKEPGGQWTYAYNCSNGRKECENKLANNVKTFFIRGHTYSIDLELTLAYSTRNLQQGHFMAWLALVDFSGDVVSQSSRPVVIPHKSSVYLFLDALLFFPLLAAGLMGECTTIKVVFKSKLKSR
jgi:hypothetical protein